jgi:hypothetical protein
MEGKLHALMRTITPEEWTKRPFKDGHYIRLEAISKIVFWFKVKAGPRFNPQAYM